MSLTRTLLVAIVAALLSSPAGAQTAFQIRGFGDVGSTTFIAKQSFRAVLGSPTGLVLGGGVEVMLPQRIFAALRASRFRKVGHRVFLFEGEQFDLGIPTTVTITPVEITGGYRFGVGWRLLPYAGAGVGWHRYGETSQFATPEENVARTEIGYHVVGGAEVRLTRWVGTAVEAQWTTVPGALGGDPNGVSQDFDESNLGGVTLRLKVIVGR